MKHIKELKLINENVENKKLTISTKHSSEKGKTLLFDLKGDTTYGIYSSDIWINNVLFQIHNYDEDENIIEIERIG